MKINSCHIVFNMSHFVQKRNGKRWLTKFSAFRIEIRCVGGTRFQRLVFDDSGSYVHYNFYPAIAVGL